MIIGVSGKKQTGKNTIGRIIQAIQMWHSLPIDRYFDSNAKNVEEFCIQSLDWKWDTNKLSKFRCVSFADTLKRMASILTGFPSVSMWESSAVKDTYNPVYGVTNREILQILGQSLRDNLSPDVWVNALFTTYSPNENWIITDVRMPNEAKAIKDRGGIIIRVNRNTEYRDTHISETALDDYTEFDYIVDNNKDIKDLIAKIESIYDGIGIVK